MKAAASAVITQSEAPSTACIGTVLTALMIDCWSTLLLLALRITACHDHPQKLTTHYSNAFAASVASAAAVVGVIAWLMDQWECSG